MSLLWKPTLAATLPADFDPACALMPYPLLASPKIDGVRAMVQGGKLVSRNGRPIPSPAFQSLIATRSLEGCDGELVVGKPYGEGVFNRTVSCAMRTSDKPDMMARCFYVFDRRGEEPYCIRLKSLPIDGTVFPVEQVVINTPLQLLRYENKQLHRGYEGIMLRRMDAGRYMEKRSTLREFYLVKLKRFEYAEAIIMSVHPLVRNKNADKTGTGRRSTVKSGLVVDANRTGSATLYSEATGEFSVAIPGDKLQLAGDDFWAAAVGRKVRYKYQPIGSLKGVPRFPTCEFAELLSLQSNLTWRL